MRIITACLMILVPSVARAEIPPDVLTQFKAYEKMVQREQLKEATQNVQGLTKALSATKRGRITKKGGTKAVTYPDKEAKDKAVAEAEAALKQAKDKLEQDRKTFHPRLIGKRVEITFNDGTSMNVGVPSGLPIGSIGYVESGTVEEVIGKDKAAIKIGAQIVMLKNRSTSGFSNGKGIKDLGLLKAVGKEPYIHTDGTSMTIPVLEPADEKQYQTWWQEYLAAKPAKKVAGK